jgi:hypothetical protein
MFHGPPKFALAPSSRARPNANFDIACMLVKHLVWLLDESQGPSQLHIHCPWLMCEVILKGIHTKSRYLCGVLLCIS